MLHTRAHTHANTPDDGHNVPAFVAADTSFVELQGIAADSLIQQDGVAGGPRKAWGSVDSPTAGS